MIRERGLLRRMSMRRRLMLAAAVIAVSGIGVAIGEPYTPSSDLAVLGSVPAGARHAEVNTRLMARERIDVALPLAEFYIRQARSTGDLRYLGYAEAMLGNWIGPTSTSAEALVLHATVLQSRHDFSEALTILHRALALKPDDAQAWLTVATVLRVLGRYDEAGGACEEVSRRANAAVAELCRQGLRGLTGQLASAYAEVQRISSREMPDAERAWRDSELGEMAVRLGDDTAAEHWFRNGLHSSPDDFYIRAAYADLLLRKHRPREVLTLVRGRESLEPLLLRIAIAQKELRDPGLEESRASLSAAFTAEAQRGDGVHRREQSRFLLEVQNDPREALKAAAANWQVQREVEDVLVFVRAANATGIPQAAASAREFVREHRMEDLRITSLLDSKT
jgi:tetratricopeptide (TPR) repeat protein